MLRTLARSLAVTKNSFAIFWAPYLKRPKCKPLGNLLFICPYLTANNFTFPEKFYNIVSLNSQVPRNLPLKMGGNSVVQTKVSRLNLETFNKIKDNVQLAEVF